MFAENNTDNASVNEEWVLMKNVRFDNDGRESNYNVFCKKGLIQEQKDFSFSQKSYHLFVSS